MEAFAAGKPEADLITNGDMLMIGAGGAKCIIITASDYSNGNDQIVTFARPTRSKEQETSPHSAVGKPDSRSQRRWRRSLKRTMSVDG
jgi:hypothetical protein